MQRIALVGFGTVGQGLCEILQAKRGALRARYGYEFAVVAATDLQRGTAFDPEGLEIDALLAAARDGQPFSQGQRDWDAPTMIRECNADVVCELAFTDLQTGEPAIGHCRAAFDTDKHVVTSNKGPAALAYREMRALAERQGVQFLIEGTVMSGTPMLNLAQGPLAGCTIQAARGILNGTTNYILTQMELGMSYEDALAKAQELGYAEADPTGDVEGHDARAKVTIIANVLMGAPVAIQDVDCEGITNITPAEIEKARAEKARWKLIGAVERTEGGVNAWVHPEMVPLAHPLAGIMGATNAATFATDLLGDVTIVGPGAGRQETGFSILTDLLRIHRGA
ncbi:MAG: homoserine dehydrogenase [Candidatus Eisenbacteria bacterium]|nr:homoserine dehydrogenase [Candidatus Eisenbacteria bacterium]